MSAPCRSLPRVLAAVAVLSVPIPAWGDELRERPVTESEREHWAFQPPREPTIPGVERAGWVRNPIDSFILRELEARRIAPSPEAGRETLLRRLRFDLTGLPPSPDEVREFRDDPAPDAYEKLVERLLASPAYGERWAQHWLDLARYADTDGFEFDQARPDAWRYRDWVVSALNDDMPYDRFVLCQLAGDEVRPRDTAAIIATGFNRCYPDMVDLNDQALKRQNALNDITETTGLVFLGLTIGCARCHDHKFDPIRQGDFYRLQAIFGTARFRDDYPIATAEERARDEERRRRVQDEAVRLQASVLGLEAPWRAAFSPGPPPGLDDPTAAAFARPREGLSPQELGLVYEAWRRDRRLKPETLSFAIALDPWAGTVRRFLLDRLAAIEPERASRLPTARILEDDPGAPSPTRFLIRGDFATPGPVVEPNVPAVFRTPDGPSLELPDGRPAGLRSALARWLNRPDHPLTARVIVNRLWQRHFGRGIVATPSDFGTMGEEPSHPELLDWLALEFGRRGRSLKALHRLMVTSATYRQSSTGGDESLAADPENHWLSRQRRTRLEGEAIRDAVLACAGQLSAAMGGPGVFPELPAELTRLSSKGQVWPVSATAEQRSRRSLYVFVRRNLRYPFFEAFDRPDTNASCPQRAATTIAPQALTLLNGRLSAGASRAFAGRVEREAGPDPPAQVRHAFLIALGREPTPEELSTSVDFLARDPDLGHLCLALFNLNEFLYVD